MRAPSPQPHCPTCQCGTTSPAGRSPQDPRWLLGQGEQYAPVPGLTSESAYRIRMGGVSRCSDVDLIYEMGMPGATLPSFRPNQWRAPAIAHARWDEGEPAPLEWDPELHDGYYGFWFRVVHYQVLMQLGDYPDPRSVVKALAERRREWHERETREHAEWLLDRHHNRSRIGAQRYLGRLKAAVMAAGGPCTYCGTSNPRSVDHIKPISRGGPDHPTNLTIACMPCNLSKGDRTPEEWRAARLRQGLPWPPVHPLPDHAERVS